MSTQQSRRLVAIAAFGGRVVRGTLINQWVEHGSGNEPPSVKPTIFEEEEAAAVLVDEALAQARAEGRAEGRAEERADVVAEISDHVLHAMGKTELALLKLRERITDGKHIGASSAEGEG